MPVLDGYKATHMLRKHAPFKTRADIQSIPIVAMTASAIQGDKEKCEKAGMDDYLAKPVKPSTLERMLVKWTTWKRDSPNPVIMPSEASEDHHSRCGSNDEDSVQGGQRGTSPTDAQKQRTISRENSLDIENDQEMARLDAQEKASSLRDTKLLDAASNPQLLRGSNPPKNRQFHVELPSPLTQENMSKLDAQRQVQDHYDMSAIPVSGPSLPGGTYGSADGLPTFMTEEQRRGNTIRQSSNETVRPMPKQTDSSITSRRVGDK